MLTPEFAMIHTATVKPFTGWDMGAPTYGTTLTLKCRVELARAKATTVGIGGGNVQEVVAAGTIFFPAGTRFEPESEITALGKTFKALSIEPQYGFEESHVEVTVI